MYIYIYTVVGVGCGSLIQGTSKLQASGLDECCLCSSKNPTHPRDVRELLCLPKILCVLHDSDDSISKYIHNEITNELSDK